MKSFDFDTVVPRRGSGSYKWDASNDPESLPMWVADMDFRTAPAVIHALERRVSHGIFGYTKVPDCYYSALISWLQRRHQFLIERDWVLYTSGVVPAISAILKALTQPGDGVIVQTPAYNCFFSSIRNMECRLVENRLICNNGYFEMDFDDLELKASDPSVSVMLLCNPHNPVGRAWTAEELQQVGKICGRHGVVVISDEIHCDLTFPEFRHQPFAALSDDFLLNSVTCNSPSKSFNIAGLQIANIIVADENIRAKIDKALNIHEVCDVNPFGVEALMAAYNEGEEWLDALRDYLYENYLTVSSFISEQLPELTLTTQEATYLAWIDCRSLNASSAQISQALQSQSHLFISEGTVYGDAGEGYIRLNMACPREVLLDGLMRIKTTLINCYRK
ncbi:MalY/PatB family protein [Vibrio mangrovi]|uniref:cysteine-S-conjugate beta-lyase n=1 Tax=Vibrio mangrovi TaxID=474394 RepID=A0A1Y6ITR9_9VIBR|nr:MalY/PatB family protein [Vibrio mangrovi]MDW6004788.1 MalY/PatB family protein [Vibrio mangrovi]SMS01079.1 Cystathionine beta-lyase PatB [Vibrio mangrovi]